MQALATQAFKYRRHEPETTLLYQVLARDWETWNAERQADTGRTPLPAFVGREMDAYFFHLPGPTDEEVEGLVSAVAHAVMHELTTHGYLTAADEESEGGSLRVRQGETV